MRIAAELASIAQSGSQSQPQNYSRGRGFNRGYRGNYRRFGSFRGNNSNRDIFHSLRGPPRFGSFPQNMDSDENNNN